MQTQYLNFRNRRSNRPDLRAAAGVIVAALVLIIFGFSLTRTDNSDGNAPINDSDAAETLEVIEETENIREHLVADTELTICPDHSAEPPPPHQLPSFCRKFKCPLNLDCDECIEPKLFPEEPSAEIVHYSIAGLERRSRHLGDVYAMRLSEETSRLDRRAKVKEVVAVEMGLNPEDGPITLFTLNGGYSYLFLNWLCSLHHNDIAQDIRKSTIIIATDDLAKDTAERVNFRVVRSEWLKHKVDEAAAPVFGYGPHKWVNAVHMVYISDLIALGYDVLSSDVDTVWIRDVRTYFDDGNNQHDVAMPFDGRNDQIGPGNSGFIHIRSNCATKALVATLIHYIGAQIHHRTDQPHWNMLLREFKDRVQFELLPADVFVNGHSFGKPVNMKYMWFAHTSWTQTDHTEKVTKFKTIDAWYFDESCPYYSEDLMAS